MNIKKEIENIKLLDKYILKQVIEVFIMGVLIFTSIIFLLSILFFKVFLTVSTSANSGI